MAYDPTLDADISAWLGNQTDEPGRFWQGTVSSSDLADTLNDPVKNVTNALTQTWNCYADNDTNRPLLGAAGDLVFGASSNIGMKIASTSASFNEFHEDGTIDAKMMIKLATGYGSKSRPFVNNVNGNGAEVTRGIYIGTVNVTTTSRLRFYINNGSSKALDITCEEDIPENVWVPVRVHADPNGSCWAQVSKGTRRYGLLGTLGTGNATSDLYLGNRLSGGVPFIGSIKNLRIGTSWTSDLEDDWDAENPDTGEVLGSPEIRVGNFHVNASKAYSYVPQYIWFADKPISPLDHTEGAVYTANSVWHGGPHGDETVTSKTVTVDGTQSTLTNGEVYEGGTVSWTVESENGPSFYQTRSVTFSGNAKREAVHFVRRDDGFAVNPFYPLRLSLDQTFTAYNSFDADGEVLVDGTLTTSSGETVLTNAVACAQFSSTRGIMVLFVLLNPGDLTNETLQLYGESDNMRLYVEMNSYSSNEGDTLTLSAVTKYYETTAGAWKALAASELGLILNPQRGRNRINAGIGLGL